MYKLPGDTWRTRHDTCKMAISRECVAPKLPHDVELEGLFAHLLPAVATEQGGELQWARAHQGLVPDKWSIWEEKTFTANGIGLVAAKPMKNQ